MIKYLCDVKECGKEATYPDSEKEWISQEMFEPRIEGASYFWARVGLANITLCPDHRREAMGSLVEKITAKYSLNGSTQPQTTT